LRTKTYSIRYEYTNCLALSGLLLVGGRLPGSYTLLRYRNYKAVYDVKLSDFDTDEQRLEDQGV